MRNKIVRATRTLIHFENGSRIITLPCSENLLRGYTAHMVICDEASWIPEEVITQVLFPMLSTTQGYALFLSTPWDKNHFFYRAFVNPNYSVHKVKSEQCPLVTKEFLEEMRQNMTREAYLMAEYFFDWTNVSSFLHQTFPSSFSLSFNAGGKSAKAGISKLGHDTSGVNAPLTSFLGFSTRLYFHPSLSVEL